MGSMTLGKREAAETINLYFISTVDSLRAAGESEAAFEFTYTTAGQITKIIGGLKATEAMGIDNIPTSILKKGVEVLAGLISHLVNCSLAEGPVPEAFKVGKVFPVYKGKGKAREDPASY
jgi:hypothetical protein